MYLDPQMQQAILLQNSGANPMMGGPGMPMGPQIDPALQRDARIMGMFSNFSQLGGGPALGNPFQQQIEGQLNNYKLMTERQNALRMASGTTPSSVREYEYFMSLSPEEQANFIKVKRGDQRTSLGKNAELWEETGLDPDTALRVADGQFVLQESDGVSRLVDKTTGDVVQEVVSPSQAATIKRANAASSAEGTKTAENVQTRMQELMDIDTGLVGLDQNQELIEKWSDVLDSDQLDTGVIPGWFATQLGIGNEIQGEALADAVEAALYNLQITNLAPVTEKEIALIKQMFLDLSKGKELNKGALKSALGRIQRAMDQAEYKANSNIRYINQFGNEEQKGYLQQFYPQRTNNIEDLL